jgi:hypothetical protein
VAEAGGALPDQLPAQTAANPSEGLAAVTASPNFTPDFTTQNFDFAALQNA